MISRSYLITLVLLIITLHQNICCAGNLEFTAHDKQYFIKNADATQQKIISELCNFDICCVCLTAYVQTTKPEESVPLDPPVYITCGGVHSICRNCYKRIKAIAQKNGTPYICPICRQPSSDSKHVKYKDFDTLLSSVRLLKEVSIFCSSCSSQVTFREISANWHRCPKKVETRKPRSQRSQYHYLIKNIGNYSAGGMAFEGLKQGKFDSPVISCDSGEIIPPGEYDSLPAGEYFCGLATFTVHPPGATPKPDPQAFSESMKLFRQTQTFASVKERHSARRQHILYTKLLTDNLPCSLQMFKLVEQLHPLYTNSVRYLGRKGKEEIEVLIRELTTEADQQLAIEAISLRTALLDAAAGNYGHSGYPAMLFETVASPPNSTRSFHISIFPRFERLSEGLWDLDQHTHAGRFWQFISELMEIVAHFHTRGYGFDGLTSHDIAVNSHSDPVILSQRFRCADSNAPASQTYLEVSDLWQGLHLLSLGKIRGIFRDSKGWMNILQMDYEGALLAVFHTSKYELQEYLSENELSRLCKEHMKNLEDASTSAEAILETYRLLFCTEDRTVVETLLNIARTPHPSYLLASIATPIAKARADCYMPDESHLLPEVLVPGIRGKERFCRPVSCQKRSSHFIEQHQVLENINVDCSFSVDCEHPGCKSKVIFARGYFKPDKVSPLYRLVKKGHESEYTWVSDNIDVCLPCINNHIIPCRCKAVMTRQSTADQHTKCPVCSGALNKHKYYFKCGKCTFSVCHSCRQLVLERMPSHDVEGCNKLNPQLVTRKNYYDCNSCGYLFPVGSFRFCCNTCYDRRRHCSPSSPNSIGFDLCHSCVLKKRPGLWK
ncbi:RING finger protein [Spongorhabdus nitratireducens]